MSLARFNRIRGTATTPPMGNAALFCDRLGISPQIMLHSEPDLAVVSSQYFGDLSSISEKYLLHPYSRVHTVSTIMDFLSRQGGQDLRYDVMTRFQLREDLFLNPMREIDVELIVDFFKLLADLPYVDISPFDVGRASLDKLRSSSFSSAFPGSGSTREAYESVIDTRMAFFDRNAVYSISRISKNDLRLKVVISGELQDKIEGRLFGSADACAYRGGVLSLFPVLNGAAGPSRIEEVQCVHRGDDQCLYAVAI